VAVEHVNNRIKEYSIRVSRTIGYKLLYKLIPTAFHKLRFNIVQTYDVTEYDSDKSGLRGTTIINHNIEKVVDYYDTLEEAQQNLEYWKMNIGTEDSN